MKNSQRNAFAPASLRQHGLRIRQIWLWGWMLVLFSVGVLSARPVQADEVPWRQRSFDLQASNEPLSSFLLRLLTLDGISATMSPTVSSGRVNGRFRGKSERVFKELAETYGLTWYYDGVTLHVYSMSEIETRLLQVDPTDVPRIDRNLKQMRLFDGRFPLRVANGEGQVLVSGPPRYVDLVEQVIGRVADTPSRPKAGIEIRVFKLKHARAGDTSVSIGGIETRISGVASTLNALLAEGHAPRSGDQGTRNLPRTLRGLRGQGLAAFGNNGAAPNAALPATAGGLAGASSLPNQANSTAGAGGTNVAGVMPSPVVQVTPQAANGPAFARDTFARADERINAVIVRDTYERMPMYAQLIAALDVESALVEIEATVVDISEDKTETLGIDWRAHGRRYDITSSPNNLAGNGSGNVGGGRSLANDLLYSTNPLSAGAGLVGTLLFGNERNYFLSRINLLAENGEAKLISRPRVLTTDNSEAVLQSTKDFYVRVAGREATDLYNVTLGMMMRVTPTLVDDEQGRRFKLQIRIEDGNTNSGQQVDQIPVVNRSAISTQAIVGEGQSLLIGGHMTEERGSTRSGVPGVSDVPVLGWLFGQRGNSVRRSERMFMITPRLVNLNAINNPAFIPPPERREQQPTFVDPRTGPSSAPRTNPLPQP
jgi:type III secretion protein C